MALKQFSPELLRMVYLLAISKKRLFGKELEDYLVSNLHIESPRTIYRWLKKIKNLRDGEQTFDYYPALKVSSFGLMRYEVIIKNPKNLNVLGIIPHTYWAGLFIDRDFNKILIVHYLIPPGSFKEFRSIMGSCKAKGLFEHHEIIALSNGKYIPSPFQDILDAEGGLKLNGNIDNSDLIRLMDLKEEPVKIDPRIINDPIMVPILMESDKESSPHEMIYSEIRKRIGVRIKDYFQNGYNRFPDSSDAGGRYIQNRLQDSNDDFDRYFDHMRIYYKPLHEIEGVQSYNLSIKLDSKNAGALLRTISEISNRSVFMTVYLAKDLSGDPLLRANINTSFENFMRIMIYLKNEGNVVEHYTLDHKVSWHLWNRQISKFNYWDLFDPIERKWAFDAEKYQNILNNI